LDFSRSQALASPLDHARAELRPARRVGILGSTGSIGRNALEVIAALRTAGLALEVVGLAAGDNVEELERQIRQWRPLTAAVRTEPAARALRERLHDLQPRVEVLSGSEGLRRIASACGADTVVAATVGVAALEAVFAAAKAGCRLALANKEALVAAGGALLEAARAGGAAILPVDSEHSAIHQCLAGSPASAVRRLILTASGGPFRGWTRAALESVDREAALRHPTWRMGERISLDSATLMNKGFEVIEACWLFGVEENRVEVLVHPQSIVHSMVEFVDGSFMAQMSPPDMRMPIQYALTYPQRLGGCGKRLNLVETRKLEFEPPDGNSFPCLGLARRAWRAGGGAPAALNAADEVAVEAFAAGRIGFLKIPVLVEKTLERVGSPRAESLEAVLEVDARARDVARDVLRNI
jgi:1-deoxy-D-xylulose-5-phosphate reductoisomerase